MDFSTYSNAEYLMTCNNMAAGLNLPPALKSQGEGDKEVHQGLPPNAPRKAFLVDEYPACPDSWPRSNGRIKSYFVPVVANRGLWLDFNQSLSRVAQHVAIVVSCQGVNAITGLPCHDPALEQYLDKCPKHKEDFGPDRLCKKCGFKWPKGNYLSSTGTPGGLLWLDGFRSEDGTVRQYVFTESAMRSVAAAIVGKDRVFAIGISYFLSKTERPKPQVLGRYSLADSGGMKGIADDTQYSCFMSSTTDMDDSAGPIACAAGPSASLYDGAPKKAFLGNMTKSAGNPCNEKSITANANTSWSEKISARPKGRLMSPGVDRSIVDHSAILAKKVQNVKQLEIAAGAKISQRIFDDPNGLDFWQIEPTAMIVINYCTEEDAERIISAGRVDLSGNPEGFLQQVPVVGNP